MLNFLYPTKDQMISYLGTVVKVAGGFLAGKGYTLSPDAAALLTGPQALQFYSGIVLFVLPMIRDKYIHSDAGKLAAASVLAEGPNPQIPPIVPLPTASPEIAALAKDPNVPGVQNAPPLPAYVPPTASTRRYP